MTAPAQLATAPLGASVEIDGRRFNQPRVEVRYEHLPLQLLQPPARAKAVSLGLATRGRHVGYLPGAGDVVAAALEEMGYEVTSQTGADPDHAEMVEAVAVFWRRLPALRTRLRRSALAVIIQPSRRGHDALDLF